MIDPRDLTTIKQHATVVYPNVLDNGSPRVQESRRFIYQDGDGKLYTDTGYKIVRCYPGDTSNSYTCYADKASL